MGVRCLSVFVLLVGWFICLLIWLVLGWVFFFGWGGLLVRKWWLYKRQVEVVSRVQVWVGVACLSVFVSLVGWLVCLLVWLLLFLVFFWGALFVFVCLSESASTPRGR